MKYIVKMWAVVAVFAFPILVFAQNDKNLRDVLNTVVSYFQIGISVLISFAVLTFVFNVYRYFFTSDVSSEKKKEAGLYVLYSIIGFFVILSMWGLVAILRNSLRLPDYRPTWPFGGSGASSIQDNTFAPDVKSSSLFAPDVRSSSINLSPLQYNGR